MFSATRCPNSFRLDVVVYFLIDHAGVWWRNKERELEASEESYGWGELKEDGTKVGVRTSYYRQPRLPTVKVVGALAFLV